MPRDYPAELRAARERVEEAEEALDQARRELEDTCARAANDAEAGLSLSGIASVLGLSKTHAHKLARSSDLYRGAGV